MSVGRSVGRAVGRFVITFFEHFCELGATFVEYTACSTLICNFIGLIGSFYQESICAGISLRAVVEVIVY